MMTRIIEVQSLIELRLLLAEIKTNCHYSGSCQECRKDQGRKPTLLTQAHACRHKENNQGIEEPEDEADNDEAASLLYSFFWMVIRVLGNKLFSHKVPPTRILISFVTLRCEAGHNCTFMPPGPAARCS